jgi:hypothetical protein
MPYVSRDGSDSINGLYANLQPGFAEEYLPDNDPEVMAFSESTKPQPPGPSTEDQVLYDHENRLRAIEGEPPLTFGQFVADTLAKKTHR